MASSWMIDQIIKIENKPNKTASGAKNVLRSFIVSAFKIAYVYVQYCALWLLANKNITDCKRDSIVLLLDFL